MRRLLSVMLLSLWLILLLPGSAAAHVFFADQTGEHGVIMHLQPDDDPIAGQSTTMYFDIKSTVIDTDTYNFNVYIIDQADTKRLAVNTITGPHSFSSVYTFPVQAAYMIRLEATPVGQAEASFVFLQPQRVTRGTAKSALDEPRHAWAEFSLIAAGCGTVVLILVVVSRRRAIARFTKW